MKEIDYEKTWHFFKEDLKDIIHSSKKFKNSPYDSHGIAETISKRLLFQMETYEDFMTDKPQRNDYQLKGWDWRELTDVFGLEDYEVDDDAEIWSNLAVEGELNYNKVLHFLQDNWNNKEVIETVREHLRKMIRDKGTPDHYDAVWQGMLNIEDDTVFMQFVFAFLGHMWT